MYIYYMAKKLSKKQVREIRALMKKEKVGVRDLAKIIGKHESHLSPILNRRRICGEATATGLSRWSRYRWSTGELMGVK